MDYYTVSLRLPFGSLLDTSTIPQMVHALHLLIKGGFLCRRLRRFLNAPFFFLFQLLGLRTEIHNDLIDRVKAYVTPKGRLALLALSSRW